MTRAEYAKKFNRLYEASARAGSAAEADALQKKLDKLNAAYAAGKETS